jgi:hypothetical protein
MGINFVSVFDWVLKGVYEFGKLIGCRFWVKWGGDVIFIIEEGFIFVLFLMVERG